MQQPCVIARISRFPFLNAMAALKTQCMNIIKFPAKIPLVPLMLVCPPGTPFCEQKLKPPILSSTRETPAVSSQLFLFFYVFVVSIRRKL